MKYSYIAYLLAAGFCATAPVAAQSHRSTADKSDTTRVVIFNREVFQYSASGRRDPFTSLMISGGLRPTIADIRLTTVAYDPVGRNSVAIMRDLSTKEQYRVKIGSVLGRMRVVRIEPKAVVFAIEEFGFSRQETLTLGDSTRTRTP
jgi:hypothetical protein